jgi:hypothetical protein
VAADTTMTSAAPSAPAARPAEALLIAAAALAGIAAAVAFIPVVALLVGLSVAASVWRFPRASVFVLALTSPAYDVLLFRVYGVADVRVLEILWFIVVCSLVWRIAAHRPVPMLRPPRWFEALLVTIVGWYVVSALAAGGIRPLVEATQTGYLAVVAWLVASVGGAIAAEYLAPKLRVWTIAYIVVLVVSMALYANHGPYTPRTVIGIPDGSITVVTRDILIQEAGADASAIARFGMLNNGPVGTAALNASLVPVALAFALTPFLRRRDRIIAAVMALGSAGGVLITYSRAGWVVVLGGAMVVLLLSGGKRAAIGLGAMAVALLIVLSLPSVTARLSELGDTNEGSYKSHERMWTTAIQMTEERPVFGWGPGNFQTVAQQLSIGSWLAVDISGDQAHNFVLELAAETGIPGALIGITLVCAVLLTGALALWKAPLPYRGVLVATGAYAFMNLTLNAFRTELMWVWMGATVAAITITRRAAETAEAADTTDASAKTG